MQMTWFYLCQQIRTRRQLMRRKIEERWQQIPIRQSRSLVSQLIKKWMCASLQRLYAPLWCVRQRWCDKVHGILGCFGSEYLAPLACLDLWKFKLGVVRVHGVNFFSGGCAKDLQLFDCSVGKHFSSGEKWQKGREREKTTKILCVTTDLDDFN